MNANERKRRLDFRRKALGMAYEAYEALVDGRAKSYTIGGRSLTKLDLSELADEIRALENEIDELEAADSGLGTRGVRHIIPMDW